MFYPANIGSGTPLTYFITGRPNCEMDSLIDVLPFAGIGGCRDAVMVQITAGNANGRFHAECVNGRDRLCPGYKSCYVSDIFDVNNGSFMIPPPVTDILIPEDFQA